MVDFSLISDTYAKIHKHLVETPLLESPFLSERLNKRVFIKAECLQKTGSFKYRGSWSSFVNNDFEDLKKGVLAYSSGNHAQGIAAVSNQLKIQATIIMPKDAPRLKIKNTQSYGANVVFYDRIKESREEIGEKLQKEKNLKLIRPYDDPFVIAGQGSLGIELINQAKRMKLDAADVLVCCGGGGLASGISLAFQGLNENFKVRTCEPENFDDMARSLKQKSRITNKAMDGSICDAILTPTPGELTFEILEKYAAPGLVASDEQVLEAMALLKKVVGNKVYEKAVEDASNYIRDGYNISTALRRTEIFPSILLQLVSTGEETGEIDDLLDRAADYYHKQVNALVERMTTLIEPLLILMVGGVIALMVVLTYLPVFHLGSALQSGL